MRRYTLASLTDRPAVDLQDFRSEIEAAVHEVMPDAVVEVYEGSYTVSPTPERGDAIRIGRKISRSGLGKYCIKIPKLFCSEVIDKKEGVQNGTEKRAGGHF